MLSDNVTNDGIVITIMIISFVILLCLEIFISARIINPLRQNKRPLVLMGRNAGHIQDKKGFLIFTIYNLTNITVGCFFDVTNVDI